MRHAAIRRTNTRHGGTLAGLLATLSILGALTAAAVVVGPRYLPAGAASAGPDTRARVAGHEELIQSLGTLLERSTGVLAIHARGASPFHEVVLWLGDEQRRGRVDQQELAVLSHSRIMRTVTLYHLRPGEPAGGTFDPASLDGPDVCNRWRTDPRVRPLVVATDVSEMRIEPVERPRHGMQPLRVSLTWAADSVDGHDAASIVVDAVLFPPSGDRFTGGGR